MKQKKMSKKLVLNKERIARLNGTEMDAIHGGERSENCTVLDFTCLIELCTTTITITITTMTTG